MHSRWDWLMHFVHSVKVQEKLSSSRKKQKKREWLFCSVVLALLQCTISSSKKKMIWINCTKKPLNSFPLTQIFCLVRIYRSNRPNILFPCTSTLCTRFYSSVDIRMRRLNPKMSWATGANEKHWISLSQTTSIISDCPFGRLHLQAVNATACFCR